MESIKFINKKTGEIATCIPISEITDWEKLEQSENQQTKKYAGLLCEECVARGRYSKSNLKIDLRNLNRELLERQFIPADELKEIFDKKVEIIKRINSIGCNCAIQ